MNGTRVQVGVDLVSVQQIADIFARRGSDFLADHFSSAEQQQLSVVGNGRLETLSGRVAAKEALIKVLAPKNQIVPWRDIEVLAEPGCAPIARFSGTAARLARARGLRSVDVSISHDGMWAIAVAAGVFEPCRTDQPEGWEQ